MLKGSKKAVITKIQPVSIHGQVSLDLYFLDPDDPQGQASRARVGQESIPRSIEAGDHVELHYVLGVVTHVTNNPSAGAPSRTRPRCPAAGSSRRGGCARRAPA